MRLLRTFSHVRLRDWYLLRATQTTRGHAESRRQTFFQSPSRARNRRSLRQSLLRSKLQLKSNGMRLKRQTLLAPRMDCRRWFGTRNFVGWRAPTRNAWRRSDFFLTLRLRFAAQGSRARNRYPSLPRHRREHRV